MPEKAELRRKAMDLLSRREHSVAELTGKLNARGFDREDVERAVQELIADGLLSNDRFVESFVRGRMERGQGPLKIRFELRSRGIEAELIDHQLDEYDAEVWLEQALRVRKKRYGEGIPSDPKARLRQMRFLEQRGFGSEQIRRVFQM